MGDMISKADAVAKIIDLGKTYITLRNKHKAIGNKKEARDYESMALALSFAADAVREMRAAGRQPFDAEAILKDVPRYGCEAMPLLPEIDVIAAIDGGNQ